MNETERHIPGRPPRVPPIPSDGGEPVVDPAVAAALGICWLARQIPKEPLLRQLGLSVHHPGPCRWCVYDQRRLMAGLHSFWEYTDGRVIDAFEASPTCRTQVRKAQGYE